jgi:hypothetical protein
MRVTVRTLTSFVPVSPPDYLEWFDLSSRPLLELALKDSAPAQSVRVEWLADRFEGRQIKTGVLTNYTQILRQPFSPEVREGKLETFAQAARNAGERILDDVENTLWFGKPRRYFQGPHPLTMCGGVYHYLRRRVYENDRVILRPLSSLMLRDFRDLGGGVDGEWLWEFSLQVIPGHYERGMKPLFLPPVQQSVKGWRQGASLEES